ncbi:MAG: type II toxin-antitoxin system RelE/ParE family toxin [Mycobacterium sp.]
MQSSQSRREDPQSESLGDQRYGRHPVGPASADGAFRVFYVTKFGHAVFVLHCFTTKSQKSADARYAR